jgi:hypothetical protein
MITTTAHPIEDELDALVIKLNYHTHFLIRTDSPTDTRSYKSNRPAHQAQQPTPRVGRAWDDCWIRNA